MFDRCRNTSELCEILKKIQVDFQACADLVRKTLKVTPDDGSVESEANRNKLNHALAHLLEVYSSIVYKGQQQKFGRPSRDKESETFAHDLQVTGILAAEESFLLEPKRLEFDFDADTDQNPEETKIRAKRKFHALDPYLRMARNIRRSNYESVPNPETFTAVQDLYERLGRLLPLGVTTDHTEARTVAPRTTMGEARDPTVGRETVTRGTITRGTAGHTMDRTALDTTMVGHHQTVARET